jgi:hypothetical protein
MPDVPQVVASVEDNTPPRPIFVCVAFVLPVGLAFWVPVCVIEGGGAVEIGILVDATEGVAEGAVGANGVNIKGGLKGVTQTDM